MNMFRSMSLGAGIILAIFGFIIFIFPNLSNMIFAMLVGFAILVVGINAVYTWFAALRGTGRGGGVLVTGILGIIFGMLCLLYPLAFAEAVEWFIAVAIIVFGAIQLIGLITTPDLNGRLIGILGTLIMIAFGIFAFVWPATIMVYVGISLFVDGLTIVIMALMRPKA